jgi:hypothetical protein
MLGALVIVVIVVTMIMVMPLICHWNDPVPRLHKAQTRERFTGLRLLLCRCCK